jgi:hydroxypyruvate reductase
VGFLLSPATALEKDLQPAAKQQALAVLEASLKAVNPVRAIERTLQLEGNVLRVGGTEYDLASYEHIYVLGAGKASAAMAQALEDALGRRITAGWINVKDGYTAPTRTIRIHEAGHPVPDARSIEGSQQIAAYARSAGPRDLVFCLISGGGSALMTLPVEGITLADIGRLTQALLRSGATINEINAIRKHLSQIKGGRLSQHAQPAQVVSLILSDVIGNPLDVIASGPTSPDSTTFAQAVDVLRKYDLLERAPSAVAHHLQDGMHGAIAETPKSHDKAFARTQNVIIASNEHAAQAALGKALELGMNGLLLSTSVEGEAREVGKVLGAIGRQLATSSHPAPRPACVLAGGETTVTVRGSGLGGRNQEVALAAAAPIAGLDGVTVIGLGTDGTDGPTDAAGAIVTGHTLRRAAEKRQSIQAALKNNDAYHFFEALGDLLITGPTNTNVNDLMFMFAF